MSKAEIQKTVLQLEELVRQLKSALQEKESQWQGIPAMCQESVSAIPDWP